jgi:hypothetical protein
VCHRTFFNRDPFSVWPEVNNVIIEFAKLNDLKIQRDQSGASRTERYQGTDGDRRVFVKGAEPEPDAHDHDRCPQPEDAMAKRRTHGRRTMVSPKCCGGLGERIAVDRLRPERRGGPRWPG